MAGDALAPKHMMSLKTICRHCEQRIPKMHSLLPKTVPSIRVDRTVVDSDQTDTEVLPSDPAMTQKP